ncbi:MAG: NADH-quinone oxidoreductase subunit J [Solirubrobacteraceae bacterium]|nr:NADH-quinone oxidoreductase subunit J [Solirubrobacteraceae bacterium]
MTEVLFFVFAVLAIGSAIGVIAMRNPFSSVLMLVVHLVALAMLFLLLHAEFVAVAQIVVYAGAVMVLYVFVSAYVGEEGETWTSGGRVQRILAFLLAGSIAAALLIAVLGAGLRGLADADELPTLQASFGGPAEIGELLLTRYLLAFEAASLLLLASAVGAVLLARRRPGGIPEGPRVVSVKELLSSAGTGSMTEGTRGPIAARGMEADRLAEKRVAEHNARKARDAELAAAKQASATADADAPEGSA